MARPEENESVLDITLKKYPKESMRKIFNLRIFLATKVKEDTTKDAIREYLKNWIHSDEVDPIVGMSFLYPGSTLHLLQGNSDRMFQFIRALVADKDKHGMWPIQVLLQTDNVPPDTIKLYDIAQIDSMKQDFFSPNAVLEVSIAEVYNAILSLCEIYSSLSSSQRQEAMSTNLIRDYFKHLPADFRVLSFAENTDITTLEEYLEIFDQPLEWTPMFETLWPPQAPHDLATIEKISEFDSIEQEENPTK